MAETKTRKVGEEQLSEVEIETLRARFAEESKDAVTLAALAEAAGLDRETVREHLRQIRTERAFEKEATPPKSPDRPNWYWAAVGGAALLVAGGITFRRLQADQATKFVYAPLIVPTTTPNVSTQTRSRPQPNFLPQGSDGNVGRVPLGFEAVAAIPGRQQTSLGQPGKVVPGPYQSQLDQIVQAIEDLANHAHVEQARFPTQAPNVNAPYMDTFQNIFTLEPGQFHYAVKGWAGRISGELKYPIGASERAQIRKAVEKMFEDERVAQAKALETPSGRGIVSPPPGYRIQFAGRRMDRQEGPALSFAPVSVALVQRRIEAALTNAIKRDADAPEGRWTENAQSERKIPRPKGYAGSIEGPGGSVPFDFPSEPPSAVKRGIRDLAARAAAQVATVNAQGGSGIQIQLNGTVRH